MPRSTHPPRFLMRYGSLPGRSSSRLLADQTARLRMGLGADARGIHVHDLGP